MSQIPPPAPRDRYWLHILLFLATLVSTAHVGGLWASRSVVYALEGVTAFVEDGLRFSLPLLFFLTVHEFGHYFAARSHRVRVSLPYYIPLPLIGIGTLGAVIRIREHVPSVRSLFDIGVAGPIAGFVAALTILLVTLVTLPPPSYMLDVEGHYMLKSHVLQNGDFPDEMPAEAPSDESITIVIGHTLLYRGLTSLFDDVPPMYEMYHYPALFASWLALFFTALNLLPVGQLDGGHVLYALVGPKWHRLLARGFVLLLLLSGGVGFLGEPGPGISDVRAWLGPWNWAVVTALYYVYLRKIFRSQHALIAPALLGLVLLTLACMLLDLAPVLGHSGWLVWCLLIVFVIKVDHPPVLNPEPLTPGRRRLGIFAMIIFVLCFSLQPISVV